MYRPYRTELDITPKIDPSMATYYKSLIDILRWIVELSCVDICLEVSMMSLHMEIPREVHLVQLFCIFAYLERFHNTELVYDPSDPVVEVSQSQ